MGADVLRFWAASTEYTKDVSIGSSSISRAAESLRKVRSTMRFLLANMASTPHNSASELSLVSITHFSADSQVDRCVLNELSRTEGSVLDSYDSYAFNKGDTASEDTADASAPKPYELHFLDPVHILFRYHQRQPILQS